MALGNTWLALSCLLACVVALWSTRTYYRMNSAALCRADWRLFSCVCGTLILWLSELVLCLRGVRRRRKAGSKTKTSWWFVILLHTAIRADDTASSLQEPRRARHLQSCSPRGWYSPVPWLGLRRAPVTRTCHAHTNTHARASSCCFHDVAVLLLRLVVEKQLLILLLPTALSSLVARNEKQKKRKKKTTKRKRWNASFLWTLNKKENQQTYSSMYSFS